MTGNLHPCPWRTGLDPWRRKWATSWPCGWLWQAPRAPMIWAKPAADAECRFATQRGQNEILLVETRIACPSTQRCASQKWSQVSRRGVRGPSSFENLGILEDVVNSSRAKWCCWWMTASGDAVNQWPSKLLMSCSSEAVCGEECHRLERCCRFLRGCAGTEEKEATPWPKHSRSRCYVKRLRVAV